MWPIPFITVQPSLQIEVGLGSKESGVRGQGHDTDTTFKNQIPGQSHRLSLSKGINKTYPHFPLHPNSTTCLLIKVTWWLTYPLVTRVTRHNRVWTPIGFTAPCAAAMDVNINNPRDKICLWQAARVSTLHMLRMRKQNVSLRWRQMFTPWTLDAALMFLFDEECAASLKPLRQVLQLKGHWVYFYECNKVCKDDQNKDCGIGKVRLKNTSPTDLEYFPESGPKWFDQSLFLSSSSRSSSTELLSKSISPWNCGECPTGFLPLIGEREEKNVTFLVGRVHVYVSDFISHLLARILYIFFLKFVLSFFFRFIYNSIRAINWAAFKYRLYQIIFIAW